MSGLAIAAAAFVVANVRAANHFWFWWDELSIIDAHSKPFKGIFLGHQGNWFPLGRLFFYIETKLFGSAYQWYVAVNAVLVLIIGAILFDLLRRLPTSERSPRRSIRVGLIGVAVVLYVTATGNLYDIQWGFQCLWFLSVLSMLIGVEIIHRRALSPLAIAIPLVVSFLFLASNTIATALLGVALLTLLAPPERRTTRIGPLRWEVVTIGAAIILVFIGSRLALTFQPPDLGAQGSPIDLSRVGDDPTGALAIAAAGIAVWMITPVSVVLQHSNQSFNAAGWWLDKRLAVSLSTIGSLLAVGAWILRGTDEVRGRFRFAVLALVGAIAIFQVQVTVRGFPFLLSNFGRRYDPSLMLLVVLAWVLVVLAPTDRRSARMLQGLAAVLLTATAAASIVTLPREIKVASYPPRINEAVDVRRSLESCVIGSRFPAYESVQPDLLDVICDRYERINR